MSPIRDPHLYLDLLHLAVGFYGGFRPNGGGGEEKR